jgi:hypothetical protein
VFVVGRAGSMETGGASEGLVPDVMLGEAPLGGGGIRGLLISRSCRSAGSL